MDYLERVKAKFNPRKTNDLVRGAESLIGLEIEWIATHIIEQGFYKGERIMVIADPAKYDAPFSWVPSGDLEASDAE